MDRLTTIGAELASKDLGDRPIVKAVLSAARLIGISVSLLIAPALAYLAATRLAD